MLACTHDELQACIYANVVCFFFLPAANCIIPIATSPHMQTDLTGS